MTKDDMWDGEGVFTDGEKKILVEAVCQRFGCSPEDLDVGQDTETAFRDSDGYAL